MPEAKKVKAEKTLRSACWIKGLSVAEMCRRAGISRNTAYEAWRTPRRFPQAAPKIFRELGITHGQQN